MIQFQAVSLRRGHKLLLEQANLTLYSGWKVGLVGSNGSGKSSIFGLLLGQLQIDQGELVLSAGQQIAHMAQETPAVDRSALDYVLDGDLIFREIEENIRLAERQHNMLHLGELHAKFADHDGYSAKARAAQLLTGLGIIDTQQENPVSSFSGGWRIRLNLAQALMRPSDLLLLDEPTNHLDMDAILWLEQWLQQYSGTLIIISHDRDFLDNTVSHIAHIERQQLLLYKGGYSAFERQRAEQMQQQQALFAKQQQQINQMEAFVRRFRAKATKAKQAQSRLKALERMEKISMAYVDSPLDFHFAAAPQLSSPLLSLQQAACGYNGISVIQNAILTLLPGDRIGLLGANGSGKSTLIKTLIAELPLVAGERQAGKNLKIGYFAQQQLEALDITASPLLQIKRITETASEQEIRNYLGGFGFHGDQALMSIQNFSGGEKARLALAIIAWQKPNLLLLDEPTNHLDLEVCHALEVALQSFDGALVLVSHDRHLLRNSVDNFLLVADGQIKPFKGDIDEYQTWLLEHRKLQVTKEQTATPDSKPEIRANSAVERRNKKRKESEYRSQLRPIKQAIKKLEADMDKLQAEKDKIETYLIDSDSYQDENKAELKLWLQQQVELNKELATTEENWLQQQELLESLEVSLAQN